MAIWLEDHKQNPIEVKPYHVPIYNFHPWDNLPSLDIVFDSSIKHYIDGQSSILKISKQSFVDINAVWMLITHLLYYNVVSVVDIFCFTNIYKVNAKIKDFI